VPDITHVKAHEVARCFENGGFEEAERILEGVLSEDQDNLLALYQKGTQNSQYPQQISGIALVGLNRCVEAIVCFDKLLARHPTDRKTLMAKGEVT
jgi:hypothetical protein